MAKMISRGITAWQGEERCSARTGTEVEIPRNPGPPAAPRTAAATLLHIFDERRGMNVARATDAQLCSSMSKIYSMSKLCSTTKGF